MIIFDGAPTFNSSNSRELSPACTSTTKPGCTHSLGRIAVKLSAKLCICTPGPLGIESGNVAGPIRSIVVVLPFNFRVAITGGAVLCADETTFTLIRASKSLKSLNSVSVGSNTCFWARYTASIAATPDHSPPELLLDELPELDDELLDPEDELPVQLDGSIDCTLC